MYNIRENIKENKRENIRDKRNIIENTHVILLFY
jgi:hypothetical protein